VFGYGEPGEATHEDCVDLGRVFGVCGDLGEVLHVLGQTPRDRSVYADAAVGVTHGHYEAELDRVLC